MHKNILMSKLNFMLIAVALLGSILVFSQISKPEARMEKMALYHIQESNQPAADFYKKQCGFCHTSEELIAPDMNKIKAVYKEKYQTKEAFIEAITKFVKNPDKKTAIYKEGIEDFMDMPKMPFKEEQIKAVAAYIYDNADL